MVTHRRPVTPLPWNTPHKKGYEIPTITKNAIRQSHAEGKSRRFLQRKYDLAESTIRKVLFYSTPRRARPGRIGPAFLLSDAEVDEIICYASEKWDQRVLQYAQLKKNLRLGCSTRTLIRRLNQRGYSRCIACQKPYLTLEQVKARFLWGIAHIFWVVEWLHILWSDEMTILIGARSSKQRVTRTREEGRFCENCIQHQFHRGHTTPVSCWGAIGYNYKSPLIFVQGTGKHGAFKQVDYLAQVLQPCIRAILLAFTLVIYALPILEEPLFIEDRNSAHSYKSTKNYCAKFRNL